MRYEKISHGTGYALIVNIFRSLKEYMPDLNDSSDHLIKKIHTLADGKTVVPMMDLISRNQLDSFAKVCSKTGWRSIRWRLSYIL